MYVLPLSISIPVCICIENLSGSSLFALPYRHLPIFICPVFNCQFFAIPVHLLVYNVLINHQYRSIWPVIHLPSYRLHAPPPTNTPPTNPPDPYRGAMPSDAEVSAARAKLAAMRQSLAGLKQHQASSLLGHMLTLVSSCSLINVNYRVTWFEDCLWIPCKERREKRERERERDREIYCIDR